MTKKKKIILGVGVVGLGTMGFFLWKHMKEKKMEEEVGPLTLPGGHIALPSHMLRMAPMRIDELDPSLRLRPRDVLGLDQLPFAPPPPPGKAPAPPPPPKP